MNLGVSKTGVDPRVSNAGPLDGYTVLRFDCDNKISDKLTKRVVPSDVKKHIPITPIISLSACLYESPIAFPR